MSIIREQYSKGSQSINFEGVYKIGENKVRINIKRDSYDNQSYARAKVFNPTELNWNFLAEIPYSEAQVVKQDVFCYRKPENLNMDEQSAFNQDIDTLLEKAREILL